MVFLLLVAAAGSGTPLLNLYQEAIELWFNGDYENAAELFSEVAERMPHQPRALYNMGALLIEMEEWGRADSTLSALPDSDIGVDSLFNASVSAGLGSAIALADHQGVRSALEIMLPAVATATGDSLTRHNYEVALRWLMENEPPPDEEQSQDQDQDQDQEQEQDEPRQPPPPDRGDMTPEEAQRILDMVEEAEESAEKDPSGPGVLGVPDW